jgi:hypothetical protein
LFPGTNELEQLSLIFKALGTPSATHWPEAAAENKNQLHFTPCPPRPWKDLVPRATESPALVDLLEQTVALDPHQRLCLQSQHVWLSDGQSFASRAELLHELIPVELEVPFFLRDDDVAIRQMLGLAARRKNLLTQLETWGTGS